MTKSFFKNGEYREVKEGFSWTILFFCFFVFGYRKQWALGAIALFAAVILGLLAPRLGLLVSIYFAFTGNKYTIQNLLKNGWTQCVNVPQTSQEPCITK